MSEPKKQMDGKRLVEYIGAAASDINTVSGTQAAAVAKVAKMAVVEHITHSVNPAHVHKDIETRIAALAKDYFKPEEG